MRDNSRAMAVTIVGAVVGGIAGYLFFTEHGKQLRRSLEPALEDLAREIEGLRTTVQRAAGVATDGWRMLNDAMSESGDSARRFPHSHQTSPF